MTVNKFIRRLLKLKGLLVTHFEFRFRDKKLSLWVKPYKNGCLCPRDPPTFQWNTVSALKTDIFII